MQFNIHTSSTHTEHDSDSIGLINMPNVLMEKQSLRKKERWIECAKAQ